MKINLQGRWTGFVALLLASGVSAISADQPARSRGTPIIFSAPSTSDTVSSNLNELRTPTAPFRDLEAGLKKPFEAFDASRSGDSFRPLSIQSPQTQQPEMNKRTLKEQMNQRAEQMFLTPELFEGEDDSYLMSEGSLDPYRQKPRTSLDRYYDRLDRNRLGNTNRPATNAMFDGKAKERPGDFGVDQKSGNALEAGQSAAARTLTLMSNSSPSSDGYFSERAKTSPGSSNPFGLKTGDDAFSRKLSPEEARLDNFKRLLEGPSYEPRAGAAPLPTFGAAKPNSTTMTPSYTWSSAPKPATTAVSANSFAKSAGLVGSPGQPQSLPEYSSSLSTPPPPPPQVKPLAPSTFSPPKRRF